MQNTLTTSQIADIAAPGVDAKSRVAAQGKIKYFADRGIVRSIEDKEEFYEWINRKRGEGVFLPGNRGLPRGKRSKRTYDIVETAIAIICFALFQKDVGSKALAAISIPLRTFFERSPAPLNHILSSERPDYDSYGDLVIFIQNIDQELLANIDLESNGLEAPTRGSDPKAVEIRLNFENVLDGLWGYWIEANTDE